MGGVPKPDKSGLVKDHEVMRIRGEPKLIEKHMMNNKRFALTVNEEKKVQLWKLDTLELAHTYAEKDFATVRQELSKHDMKHSPEDPLPQTWMSLDIGLGALSLHLEAANWLKGVVDDKKSNVMHFAGYDSGDTPGGGDLAGIGPINRSMEAARDGVIEEEKKAEEGKKDVNLINMGKRAVMRLMGPQRRQMQED
eukprot:CAMPEP_0185572254 /NCGR_PEP_ID=MMETSP0434-20130131/4209_1 /TAXON_ID=626734 ORGANISM="Favella taraikaensis, Strain Fe Narragansett Bay" /NCGR_SAMPLE_ID=MMETSP0434 /ASSEMBLY_ACC=CAM_ASM_000379 /LENGTH=194 /DNA_ID=CAMNT_0028188051 /DNA_START=1181 /DNA_END=1766 /DNA_ORIENTATION=+